MCIYINLKNQQCFWNIQQLKNNFLEKQQFSQSFKKFQEQLLAETTIFRKFQEISETTWKEVSKRSCADKP